MIDWPSKDPGEAMHYGIDFVDRVSPGVVLNSATWTISPAGLTKSAEIVSGTLAQLTLAGGALGDRYLVNVSAVTSDGQTLEETALLEIRGR